MRPKRINSKATAKTRPNKRIRVAEAQEVSLDLEGNDDANLAIIRNAGTSAASAVTTFLTSVQTLVQSRIRTAVAEAVIRRVERRATGQFERKTVNQAKKLPSSTTFKNKSLTHKAVSDFENDPVTNEVETQYCRARCKGRNRHLGGCGRRLTVENPAATCDFDDCKKHQFCTDCKLGRPQKYDAVKGRSIIHGTKSQTTPHWFCSDHCLDLYNAAVRAENEELDRKEADKKARGEKIKVECMCGKKFTKKNLRTGCALMERCKRSRPCKECVDSGMSQRSVKGKSELGGGGWVFCSQGCKDIFYGELSDDD